MRMHDFNLLQARRCLAHGALLFDGVVFQPPPFPDAIFLSGVKLQLATNA
jgi:hypothetical protein